MVVREAKHIAEEWVRVHGSATPGFAGAFFHGSVNWQPDHATLPATSDLDIMLALAGDRVPPKPGKFSYRNVLLEASYIPAAALGSPEQVLGEYNLAGSFHVPSVILDPSGNLGALQAAVAAQYAQRRWVRARCAQARDKVAANLAGLDAAAPFHEQVNAWLFATGVTTHVLLVAGLKNPTVRRRYAAVRELLREAGRLDFYELLLALLGCERMGRGRAALHLDALAAAYDDAVSAIRTPFPFASDISEASRPIAIDAGREMIAGGRHREAVFWLAVTYSRCMMVFEADARPLLARHGDGYRRLANDLGIAAPDDVRRRADHTLAMLPHIWSVAEQIMAANPEIEDND